MGTNTDESNGRGGQAVDPAWAWARFTPDARQPWDLRWVGHLFRRAGFGAGWGTLQQALKEGPRRTIERLLRPETDVAEFNRTHDQYEEAAIDPGTQVVTGLQEWWLRRMIDTPQPLLEKMALFWHGFFGTSNLKVENGLLMQRHIQVLRQHALGRFSALLEALLRDPATLVSNWAAANRKAQPNLRLGRAVLEHFTLGPGQFTEADVRGVASALTGWFVVQRQLRFFPHEQDEGNKTILGQTGPWRGEDVVRIVLQQPTAARHVVRKLYSTFISETGEPTDEFLAPLAEFFRRDYDIARLVETMLASNLFFSATAYRQRIKSPVEFALGIVKGMEAVVPTRPLSGHLAALGQALGQPPTVRGWAGGRAWLTPLTLVARDNLALALLGGTEPYGTRLDPLARAQAHGAGTREGMVRFMMDLFLQGDVPAEVAAGLANAAGTSGDPAEAARNLAQAVTTLPEFQLA